MLAVRKDFLMAGPIAHLKRYVLITKADFKLLSAVFVLLWPFGVVFPGRV